MKETFDKLEEKQNQPQNRFSTLTATLSKTPIKVNLLFLKIQTSDFRKLERFSATQCFSNGRKLGRFSQFSCLVPV